MLILGTRKDVIRHVRHFAYVSGKVSIGKSKRFRFVKRSGAPQSLGRVLRDANEKNEKLQPAGDFVLWANYLLVERGKRDAAIDLLFDDFDGLMRTGDTRRIRRILISLKYSELDTDILLAILTATLPVKSVVPERQSAFLEIKRVIEVRNDMEDGLLDGLE